MLKIISLLIHLLHQNTLYSHSNPASSIWEGWHLKGYLGGEMQYSDDPYKKSVWEKKSDPMAGFSVEYSWVFDKLFLSTECAWLYYPDLFQKKDFKGNPLFGEYTFPSWYLLFFPITGAHAGYITDKNDVITIGLAYFWGITSTFKHQIDENLAFEARSTWFYDRVLYGDGLHDIHLLIGISYKF